MHSTCWPNRMQLTAWHPNDRALASLAVDAFLLARHCSPGHTPASGRAWEGVVSELLWRPSFTRRQHAGVLGLFGQGSRSGARHEIDGVGQGPDVAAWIESKARMTLDKSDVAVFHLKCFDLYREAASEYPEQTAIARWWPLLVSSEPTGEAVRRMCADLGVVVCDPQRLPLPALLFAASRPNADDYLPEIHLAELVRLAEAACAPMQRRWRVDMDRREVCLHLDTIGSTEIADLLFLQDELTEEILDVFEVHAPGVLDQRASALVERFEAARMAS